MGSCSCSRDHRTQHVENEPDLLEPLKQKKDLDLNKCEEFDDVLKVVGPQGRFQKFLLYFVVCPVTAIQPFLTLNAIFLLFQPDHWCHVPGSENINITDLDTWKSIHIPLDYERPKDPATGLARYSRCTMYDSNRTIVQCLHGWDYDKTEYESTISSAFNWVCADAINPTNSFTAQAIGNAVGTIIFGQLADKVGRKPIFFLTIFITILFRIVSFFFTHNINLFLLMQFLVGSAFPVMFITPSMIAAEVSDKDYRGWVYAVTWMIWVVGMSALPLVVWVCKEWLVTGIATTIPGFVLFLFWFHMPESPRWLLSIGRVEDASRILMQVAESNGTADKITQSQLDKTLQRVYDLQDKNEGAIGVWTLFSRFRLAKNTLLLTLCWSINIVVYYGLTLNTTHMSGNMFVNFFLLSIIELPSGIVGGYLVERAGRRWTQVLFFCLCAFTCVAAATIVQYFNKPLWEILTVILAKFAVTLTFLVVYLQGAEIFPTQLRSTGSGFASTVGAACGIVGPIMVALGTYHLSYPYWIMGALSFVGMIAAAFLPETLNQNLPESIDDADDFGKHNKFWSLYPKPVPRSKTASVIDLNVQSMNPTAENPDKSINIVSNSSST